VSAVERELTIDLMNVALLPVSQERGYCLCIHPFMNVINFSGTSCAWCYQPVTDEAWGPEAKAIRTEAVKAAYPWAVKEEGSGEQDAG
jgi:hypothetical protein